jgi:hypothetical protein
MKTFITLMFAAVFCTSALAGSAETNSIASSLYKTVVNKSTGDFAIVDANTWVFTLYDKTNHVVWTTNIVMGLKTAPVLGEPKIWGMQVNKGELWG